MLSVDRISVYYDKIRAIKDVSFGVKKDQLVLLLGANGTGKTTILNTISGFINPRTGTIKYKEERIERLRPNEIVRKGIVQVSQNRDLFNELSVIDNLALGAVLQNDKKVVSKSLEMVFNFFPRLKEREKQLAGALSGGEQQMLSIGRALMSQPKLLLLDEPTTGLAPIIVKLIASIIKKIKEEGNTILLVEQNAIMAAALAEYYYILRDGQIVKEGATESLPENLKEFFKQFYI